MVTQGQTPPWENYFVEDEDDDMESEDENIEVVPAVNIQLTGPFDPQNVQYDETSGAEWAKPYENDISLKEMLEREK